MGQMVNSTPPLNPVSMRVLSGFVAKIGVLNTTVVDGWQTRINDTLRTSLALAGRLKLVVELQ
jgi:uncharacterized protein (DUF4415 family)